MSKIGSKDTNPEMLVRRFLHSKGIRFRLHTKNVPGKPDLVLKKYNAVIFIHGCFWHAHKDCKYATIPKTRSKWWHSKLELNKARDTSNYEKLNNMGLRVLIVWSCELKGKKAENTLKSLLKNLCIK